MPARSSACAAGLPAMPLLVTSISSRWLSVPPETNSKPRAASSSPSAFALVTTCCAYARKSSVAASFSATAIAAVVWLCGPPCRPGKTARSTALACSSLAISIAPRGPRRVLCVVVETTSACGIGEGCTPAAIRPAMCATSAASTAPTSWAISANAAKSMVRGTAVPPQKISFGRSASARSRTSSMSIRPVSLRTPYCTPRNHLPVAETPQPWVRWPPIGSDMPSTVSPGCRNAR